VPKAVRQQRIMRALKENPEGLCDRCLMALANFAWPQVVGIVCRHLVKKGECFRQRWICHRCKQERLVNRHRAFPKTIKRVRAAEGQGALW